MRTSLFRCGRLGGGACVERISPVRAPRPQGLNLAGSGPSVVSISTTGAATKFPTQALAKLPVTRVPIRKLLLHEFTHHTIEDYTPQGLGQETNCKSVSHTQLEGQWKSTARFPEDSLSLGKS